MTRAWQRLLAFVPTRRAASCSSCSRSPSSGSRRSAGRWRRVATRGTTSPTTSSSSTRIRRSPSSSSSARRSRRSSSGCRSTSAAAGSSRSSSALLYATAILAWSATALTFGRIPALFSAGAAARLPGVRDALPPGLERRRLRDRARALGAAPRARACDARRRWRFVALGAGIAVLVLIRPANQVLLPLALVPLVAAGRLAPAPRAGRAPASRPALVLARRLGAPQRHPLRRRRPWRAAGARGCRSCIVFTGNRTISPENGEASRRLARADRAGGALAKDPHAGLDVTARRVPANGSNYETVRLIALSDRVLGRDENYDVLFDSALEAIREHPGTYFRGVADTFWEFLVQRPLREDVAPREQTAPEPPPPTFESRRRRAPEPAGDRPPRRRAVRVRLVRVRLHRLVHARGSRREVWSDPATQERYREIVAQVRAWDAELPVARGRRRRARDPQPRSRRAIPTPAALARRRASSRSLCGGPRGWRTILLLWAAAFLVLLDPRRLAGRRSRVRAAAVPGLHRDRALRACGRRGPTRSAASIERVSQVPSTLDERAGASTTCRRRSPGRLERERRASRSSGRRRAGRASTSPSSGTSASCSGRSSGATSSSATSRRSSGSPGRSSCRSSRRSSTSSSSAVRGLPVRRHEVPGARHRRRAADAVLRLRADRLEHEPGRESQPRHEGVLPAHAAAARRRDRPARRLPRRPAGAPRRHVVLRHVAAAASRSCSRRCSWGSPSSRRSASGFFLSARERPLPRRALHDPGLPPGAAAALGRHVRRRVDPDEVAVDPLVQPDDGRHQRLALGRASTGPPPDLGQVRSASPSPSSCSSSASAVFRSSEPRFADTI